jgi:hypothetical protein
VLVNVRVHTAFKCALLPENGIRRLTLFDAEVSGSAGATELKSHHKQALRPRLRAVMDTLRKVTYPPLGKYLFTLVGVVALNHESNLVEVMSMPWRRPPTRAGAS